LVFHFDEVRFRVAYHLSFSIDETLNHAQVHHILAEIIQGGVVLETNLEEIDSSGKSLQLPFKKFCSTPQARLLWSPCSPESLLLASLQNRDCSYRSCTAYSVHRAASARKQSFTAANPLALGVGGVGPRSTGLQTPLGWLTGKLTGVGAR
jgi:AP-3 complex subunit sigma